MRTERPILLGQVATTATPQVFAARGAPIPGTFWVRPASGNTFTVEYSTDNGANWQPVPGLNGSSSYNETLLQSDVTHVRITPSGTQGGSWGVC